MSSVQYIAGGELRRGTRLRSAAVTRIDPDRGIVSLPNWRTVPISSTRFQLVVNGEFVDERSTDIRRIEELIPALERAESMLKAEPDAAERSLEATFGPNTFNAILDESGALLLPTGEVAVGFEADTPEALALATIERHEAAIVRRLPLSAPAWLISAASGDGIELAASLLEEDGVRFASPNFIEEMPERRTEIPLAALFEDQWHLENTGQGGGVAGADVNAREAWRITRGSPDIVVCIIDSGVDLSHPAFLSPGKIVAPLDVADDDLVPQPIGSSHGTSCAGVAVAGWETSDAVGIAPNCRLMPIRRAAIAEHVRMAEAIGWAWQQGADIISCSFGYDGRPWTLPDVVRAALEDAVAEGREGRGAVVVWAAGNGDEPISDDEWASHPDVLAVAASTDMDRRAPYSDFGPEVDVCAPSSGGMRAISTTSNGGYTSYFGGTSSAAPLAAGVGALLLSVCPSLTGAEVRAILRASAVVIDPEDGGYDESGHSPYYGFGRVDAALALRSISPAAEALRESPALADIEWLDAFADAHLRASDAGRLILAFLEAQRFTILALLKDEITFRLQAQHILETVIAYMKGGQSQSIPVQTINKLASAGNELIAAANSA